MKYSCLILFWLVILFSCGRLQNPVMPEAATAECMLDDNPDSLACILEKINPEALPDSSKAYYWWLLIHAHARSGRSLVNDSLIYYSVQYYKEQQSPRLALAYFLAGAYEYKKSNGPKNYDTMERMFLKALNEAKNQKDTTLLQYNDSISNAIGQMMMLDNERVVAQATLEKDKLMLEVEKGDLQQGYLWVLVGVLVLIGFLIYFYQRRLLEKERSIQRAKEQIHSYTVKLVENETVIRDNEELIRNISTQLDESAELKDHLNEQISEIKQISLNNEILQKQNEALQSNINEYTLTLLEKDRETDTYQRLAEQIAFLQGREKFLSDQLINHIDTLNTLKQSPQYIADEQWPEIINIINLLYNNFTNRLHIDCPSLTEEDLHYCCLIKLRLSTSAIARQTAISPTSVTKRKQRIKEKINQYKKEPLGKDQSVETYLWSY